MTVDPTARPVIALDDIVETDVAIVGGKAANLGALATLDCVDVPPGFCVTTDAFAHASGDLATIDPYLDRLARLGPTDDAEIRRISEALRDAVAAVAVPDDVASAIADAIAAFGDTTAFAVRSSATAEDLPTASFAGQHDSYLDIDAASVVDHVRRCWASLFNERAIVYRITHDIDHHQIRMAVVVQELIDADASGVLFTADPATSNRTVTTIEATDGLGDALVSGRVNPDVHRVRDNRVVDATISSTEPRAEPVLPDAVVLELAELGRRIESHFGCPQDIEWCVADGRIHVVQARPITTLFPIPAADDDAHHVYISVGHNQMMTDAMKPLGLSVWQLTTRAPMAEAGGRLFVDVTPRLASPDTRTELLAVSGRSDPLLRDALETIVERGDFLPPPPPDTSAAPLLPRPPEMLDADPAIVTGLIDAHRRSVDTLRREIETQSGVEVFDVILADLQVLRQLLFDPHSLHAIITAMDATAWLNEHVADWLGDDRPTGNIADTVTRSAPNNVTSEMGLALLDVADVIRPHADVVAHLEQHDDADVLSSLDGLGGGTESRVAIEGFLDRYGMRCVGEIDITRPRWAEHPAALVPTILANVHNLEPGESRRRFERGEHAAERAEHDVLEHLRALPDGDDKAEQTKQMIDRVRTFIGYREYPKYGMVSRYHLYKQAMLREAGRLVDAGVLTTVDDAYFLTFHELRDAIASRRLDHSVITERRNAHRAHERLTPPRVLTSDGECLSGTLHRDDLPPGALPGLGVSSGIVEGRARVVTDLAHADVQPGDILVTTYTDPSWSPAFVTIAGLVTEVGGYMTHGAVVAREYGLPALVAVERATTQIRDGQRIRLNADEGYVEALDPLPPRS